MKSLLVFVVSSLFLLSLVGAGYAQNQPNQTNSTSSASVSPSPIPSSSQLAAPSPSASPSEAGKPERIGKSDSFLRKKFGDKADKLDRETTEKLTKLPPGIAKKFFENSEPKRILDRWETKAISREGLKTAFIKREITSDNLKAAGDRLKAAKENLEKAKADFKAKKDQFKKTKTLEDAKSYLSKVIDAFIARAGKIKSATESSKDISEDKSKEVLADIDSRIEKLNDWKTKVEAAKTKEELKLLISQVKDGWEGINRLLKLHGWRVEAEHFGGLVRQTEQLDNKLNRLLAFADKNNATIKDKDARIASLETKLDEARKHHEAIASGFTRLKELVMNKTGNITGSDASEKKVLVDSIQEHLKTGKQSLREARDILVGLVKDAVKGLSEKKAVTDSGKPAEIKEESALDPTKVIEGVDITEGETTTTITQEKVEDL